MQQISIDVLKEKYLKPGEEDAEAIFKRVAMGLAAVELPALQKKIEALFLKNMLAGAIGAGRIMSAGGTGIQSTLINCFVQPVGDCIQDFDEDGFPGIYEALKQAAETMRRGGGVGYDFSRIRPKGAEVKGTASFASGPCSYINVFDQSCSTVESAGSRRGAQMGVLKIDHPDIFEFINAKRTPGRWNNFNVSVGVSDEFMRAVERDSLWDLVHKAKPSDKNITKEFHQRADGLWVYQTIKAKEIWHLVMESAYDFAEPGILFLDNINSDNNLSYCESIEATNPCGEQPLPPYGCCDLGPIILPRFVINPFGFAGTASFDYPGFIEAVKIQVRMLDNVLDVTYWPLKEQAIEAQSKRRIGVGFTGLGDALIMLKLAYNSNTGRSEAANIAKHLRDAAYQASVDLAKEKGAFPALDIEQYLGGTNFANRLDSNLKTEIRKFGIRNSHLLSIAPTGTVSLAFADNASNGIEPPFSWAYQRKKREADGSTREYSVEDHAWRVFKEMGGDINALPDYFITALTMSAEDHIAMMEVVQPYIDTAISKTVNVPADYPFASFVNLYLKAWQSNLKGLATYRPNSILGSVLHVNETEPEEIPITTQGVSNLGGNPSKKVVDRRPNGELPAVAEKINYWTQDGQKTLYLIISFLNVHGFVNGEEVQSERAIEFFMPVGQSGESQQWITSSMRLLSLAARGGFLVRALGDMRKVAWDRGPVRLGTRKKDDGIEVPMWHDSEVSAVAFAIENILIRRGVAQFNAHTDIQISNETAELNTSGMMRGKKCPECGAHALIKKDGCEYCTNCGFIGACG
ncbi:adenosylcobalamin-dependent ribonucleoside-diphosphate reductase [Polynucleobacter sp. IMCC 30228]|uniref:adenosylcobalamin-dependent ribonucleoside-diphosphate reductase n=1 Tax=Polynucleobacter sp. IMCC 30228 TaxID=2781011 RepID=UPI001F371B07|nr:adenosylcobalamin-dependent ribonucleoside-diphosphate reductase [Polynucleobacter sp. IMCC 30228]MCE7527522.1 adenosylcobalamin-dependent ribonucleoside-diphosphate reductase [Polynucleobacter sp. IMCC 30228]